ncbi:hypothetical protein EJ06DRAFT_303116 [Trichodelitschia bisporula]|uniref:Large ribosomal subunit protein bL21m n=1 Tax=Trichodelitschia bisporula TaxID=703511 RepID=A0A6G1I6W2_9PEZI|nr:hypothetical protein EJ06DRAFT_303116 [Trichodelitschia bisporula]
MASLARTFAPFARAVTKRPRLDFVPPLLRSISTTSPIIDTPAPPPQVRSTILKQSPPARIAPTQPATRAIDPEIHPSVPTLLPLLRSQPPYYATICIYGKHYLVTAGDEVRLPFLMHGVQAGDVLRLNRAVLLGSRDYTLKAGAGSDEGRRWLDERLFAIRARVIGIESEPMRMKEKTKRRQRHVRTIKSKHKYTVIRITEVNVLGQERLIGAAEEGAVSGEIEAVAVGVGETV